MNHLVHLQTVTWPRNARADVVANAALARQILEGAPRDRRLLLCFPEAFLCPHGGTEACATLIRQNDEVVADLIRAGKGITGLIFLPTLRENERGLALVTHCFDGEGTLLGTYAKRHVWPSSSDLSKFEFNALPGNNNPVIEWEGLRLGIQMCFDVNWPTGWGYHAARDVDLIVYPSAYPGGFALQARAWETQAVVAAAVLRDGPSPVIDITGEITALRTFAENHIPLPFNLNRIRVHLDHQIVGLTRLVREMPEIQIRRMPRDNVCLVEGPTHGPSIRALLDWAGLVGEAEYLRRACAAISARSAEDAAGE